MNTPEKAPQQLRSKVPLGFYDESYARNYIMRTLGAPYTKYKNALLAHLAQEMKIGSVVDIGGNVSGILRMEGSLRYQLEKYGITYGAIDLTGEYFDPNSARKLGVSEEYIYNEVNGLVASAEDLPFPNGEVECIVCADVIEHVPEPQKAFDETARVLQKNGKAIYIIPSMYKLDLCDFDYVEEKRTSSHESKLIIDDWSTMWEKSGLEVDPVQSRPVGIATGLSFLSWLDDEVIPERPKLDSKDSFSQKSLIHREAKRIIGLHDEAIDAFILENNFDKYLAQALSEGDIKEVMRTVHEAIRYIVSLSPEDKIAIDTFFEMVRTSEYPANRVAHITNEFSRARDPRLLLGNSVLVVLKHR